MDFKMENFKIGVNENGFHFQDTETGVIFTLRKAGYESLDIAVCMSSANESVCKSLKAKIRKLLAQNGLEVIKRFQNIEKDKCYISESQELFVLESFAGDGIGIRHLKTNKGINLERIEEGIPVTGLFLESQDDYEEAVKDFFEICSSDIKEIITGTYHGSTQIKREYSIKKIQKELLECLIEGVKNSCIRKEKEEPIYEVTSDKIIINRNTFSIISNTEIKKRGNAWYVNALKDPYPVLKFVHVIEAVKRYQQINRVYFYYKLRGERTKVCITQKNTNNVLKNTIKNRKINLTV